MYATILPYNGKTMSIYRDIFETLKREIQVGKFDVDGKFPSERALMRRFSVARETVRHAIVELRKHNLIEPRQGTLNVLTFRARERAIGTFGVIMPDAYYQFYSRIQSGIEKNAHDGGSGIFSLLSADLGSNGRSSQIARAFDFAEVCVREKVLGVFFQPFQFERDSEKVNKAILSVFDNASIPVVLIDSDIVAPPRRSGYDLVGVDNVALGYELGRHVITRGARKIIYFSNPYAAPTSLLRGYGVSLAVTEVSLPWRNDSVFFADPTDKAAARRLFSSKKRPDAIIAVNDYVASLLLKTLNAIGIRVPVDVLLTGVNGDDTSSQSNPPITTAVQPCERIGEAAVQLMLQRIKDPLLPPREMLLTASLEVRSSTRRKAERTSKSSRKKGKST
jgi:LacI family transcriptional regulator